MTKMSEPGYRLEIDNIGLDLSQEIEVARIFVSSDEETTVIINAHAVEEAYAFGVICVDFMKHAARAYVRAKGGDPNEVFEAIVRGVSAELEDPTGEVRD